MNKYKIVSLVLVIALLATMAHLVATHKQASQSSSTEATNTAEVVMHNILSRKSVRSYTDRAVSREQLDTLVRAAMAAPTGRDMRPWKFIVVDNKATIDSLAPLLPYAKMLKEAQAAIVVCGDLSVTDDEASPPPTGPSTALPLRRICSFKPKQWDWAPYGQAFILTKNALPW